ncbi:MAG: flagellar hook-length control protein FliK [Rickettsiales bacterium]
MTSVVAHSAPSLLGSANAPGQSLSLFDSGDDAGGDLFSQLLGSFDSGQGQSKDTPQNPVKDVALLAKPGELLAQEAAALGANQSAAKLAQLLERPVTPQDAVKLLATLNASADAGDGESPLRQQLKDQLTQLAQANEPQTVAQIIQALPAVQEASANAALNAQTRTGGAVQQVLRLLQGALSKTRELAATKDADVNAQRAAENLAQDAALQSLQAANFRTAAAANAPTPVAPKEEKTDELTTVEITPLSQQVIVPQWVNNIGTSPIPVRADLDTVIPPLSDGLGKKTDLPHIDLPKADLGHEAAAKPDAFQRHLSENASNLAVIGEAKRANEASLKPIDRDDANINATTNPSATGGHSATQSAQAVQPAAVTLPANVINHAPIAEQVHVAVARASKDGIDQITIQLSPEHLGRVEVKFHTNAEGQTLISFIADRPDTFDALSRDARSLETALQESGIKADAGSMQFNLRQQPQPQPQLNSNLSDGRGPGQQASAEDETASPAAAIGAVAVQNYRINIHDGVDIHA